MTAGPRARTGYVNETSGSDKAERTLLGEDYTPIYETYFAGGGSQSYRVRGFEFGGAGSHGEGSSAVR